MAFRGSDTSSSPCGGILRGGPSDPGSRDTAGPRISAVSTTWFATRRATRHVRVAFWFEQAFVNHGGGTARSAVACQTSVPSTLPRLPGGVPRQGP